MAAEASSSTTAPPVSTETTSPTTKFHPALGVTNIKNHIPILLDLDHAQYTHWSELFETHAHAYNVLDHIHPSHPRPPHLSDTLWQRLDSIVKIWLYSTISDDIRNSILSRGATALETWGRIHNLFQDNKASRAIYLENQYNNLHVSGFPSITAYCAKLKSISDQLHNVDHPITDQMLVPRLISGLRNSDYDIVATLLQQSILTPSFAVARSRLLLEEPRRATETTASPSALVLPPTAPPFTNTPSPSPSNFVHGNGRGSTYGGRGRGRGRHNKGRGC